MAGRYFGLGEKIIGNRVVIKDSLLVTMEPAGTIARGHIVIEDGVIAAIGEGNPPRDVAADQVLGGPGMAALPGLVNLHAHSHSSLTRGTAEGLPLEQWLSDYIVPEHRVMSTEDCYIASLVTYAEALKGGTTCLLDMPLNGEAALRAAGALGIRVTVAPYLSDALDYAPKFDDNLKLLSSVHVDGDLRQAWVGFHQINDCSRELLLRLGRLVREAGVGVHTHLAETREEVEYCRKRFGMSPVEYLREQRLIFPMTVLAHGIWLSDVDIGILSQAGASIAHCPASNMKLASGVAPVAKCLEAGLNVGVGTDGAKSNNNLDMFEEMKLAALLQRVSRGEAGCLPPALVLQMATTNGAKALGLDHLIGSLRVGKQADIVLVDVRKLHLTPAIAGEGGNLEANLVFSARGSDVDTVLVKGEVVVRGGRPTRINEGDLILQVDRVARDLLARARGRRGSA